MRRRCQREVADRTAPPLSLPSTPCGRFVPTCSSSPSSTGSAARWPTSTPCSTGRSVKAGDWWRWTSAQWERRTIGQRTRVGLAAKKASGVRLGRPPVLPQNVVMRVRHRRPEGVILQAIADELNTDGVPTARGTAPWRPLGGGAAAVGGAATAVTNVVSAVDDGAEVLPGVVSASPTRPCKLGARTVTAVASAAGTRAVATSFSGPCRTSCP